MILNVPTINDSLYDIKKLYRLYDASNTASTKVELDFKSCGFLRQNAVAFLAGLIEWTLCRGVDVRVRWETCQPQVIANLKRNGFCRRYLHDHFPIGENAIKIEQFRSSGDEDRVVSYLLNGWIGKGWLSISEELAGAIIGNVWEIFANSFEHSRSRFGVLVAGQHYPTKHELALTVVDFGVGIPGEVRRHLSAPDMSAEDAFRWALSRGNSTRVGQPGGLGLDMLKEFIAVNNGEMAVYSRDGYFRWFGRNEEFGRMGSDFHGTLVNLSLKCDDRYYAFG